MRRVRVTNADVEMQYVLHILCVCVFVASGIQYVMHMRHTMLPSVACLSRYTIFFHIIS